MPSSIHRPAKHTSSSHSSFRNLACVTEEELAATTAKEVRSTKGIGRPPDRSRPRDKLHTYFGGKEIGMETVVGDLMATELRLGLPGTAGDSQQPQMRAPSTPRGKKRTTTDAVTEDAAAAEAEASDNNRDVEAAPPAAKAPVVGWPPVRSYRKSCFVQQAASSTTKSKQLAAAKEEAAAPTSGGNTTAASAAAATAAAAAGGSFVKVSMDGAPYLRKVDLRMYKGYRELREALEAMFASSNTANLSEFAVTYEDKDGDLMLVGDVPFEMFTGTCKKLRIMKRSEATGLGSARQ